MSEINPNDVNLLIFDTDGTIFPTTIPVYHAIKKVFGRLGWPVPFSGADIEQFFGMKSGEVYEYITPAGESWEEVREKIRTEYPKSFLEYAETYPRVRETLALLRKRGYRLALYSNASPAYFDTVVSTLGIGDYFDYIECIGENNLTKSELIEKIKTKFDNPVTAVVGDRVHDIEAAAATGSLSIGALYGYGQSEPEQADLTIGEFKDLLSVFDRRLPIFDKISEEIDRRKGPDRPYIIGINGIDCSGKTIFTEALARFLISRKFPVQVVNLDDFHNPRQIRNSGADPVASYYDSGFDIEKLVDSVLRPARERNDYTVSLTLLDVRTDRYEIERDFSFNKDTIVLLEGVYLFKKELLPYMDYKIFLDILSEESRRRAAERDVPVYGEGILKRYDEKYLPVQARYLKEYPPSEIAELIIDNNNPEYPVIKLSLPGRSGADGQ